MFAPKPQEFLPVESAQQLQELIPMRNQRLRHVDGKDGIYAVFEVDLNYTGFIRKRMARALKASKTRRVQLEGIGLEIFELVDGQRRVRDIIDQIADRHLLSFFESRGVVFYYLQLCTERGLVAIGGQTQDAVDSPDTAP
ncbi:MAG: hypothetical protein ACOCXA_04530 [Planctomycetota bacterium]